MKRVMLHILFWVVYLTQDTVYAYLAGQGFLSNYSVNEQILIAIEVCLAYLIPKLILTYFLLYVMIEKVIKHKKDIAVNVFYISLSFIITLLIYRMISYYLVSPVLYKGLRPSGSFFNGVNFLFATIDLGFVSGMGVAIKLIRIQIAAKDKEKVLVKDKLETEIKFLKNQTNPHFLFNTLNNIYALARKKSDSTGEVVLKLSKILRFMLYDTGKQFITIGEEIRLIEDYIDLEKIRYDRRLSVTLKKEIDNEAQIISPLLLLPFVENAFKHGAGNARFESYIHIRLKVSHERLLFCIENNKEDGKNGDNNNDCIGLVNIRRQLELLYGEYNLDVENLSSSFKVNLHVNLESYGKV